MCFVLNNRNRGTNNPHKMNETKLESILNPIIPPIIAIKLGVKINIKRIEATSSFLLVC